MRIKFTAPINVEFKALEIDTLRVNPDTGDVSGSYSLIKADGKRWRSIDFAFSMNAAVDNFVDKVLQRLANKVDQVDGQAANLAGTIEIVPVGSPVP